MPGAESMIKEAEKSLGLREPNHIQSWYCSKAGICGNFAWCNASVTYWAWRSGNQAAVTFGGYYAYTVAHANAFKKRGQWHTDVAGIRRGDIVFFDWAGSNSITAIDHVGIVTDVKGGKVYTIEGNTNNVCARRVRDARTIAGYGRPKYPAAAQPKTHTVRAGDTLSEIADRYRTTVAKLAAANGIRDEDLIYPGQVLKLP
jgi:LysM repeat protein